ncbi:MAG: DUF4905 domain-containing protein [Ignavibacterium sp.]|nr:DUF4905 domain-containing protein [Ignavibacterium sp.]MDW8374650.1 DUF4905 domain-containing protein [Ignavibacteriales bacterium]
MKIKKLYKYDRRRQLFRLLPTETNKLIIEERDLNKKEVFFSCLELHSGKKIFYDLQFEEKYWIGIKVIYKDVIYFHRFERPDLPNHKGIIAFDIKSQTVLWENQNNFLFIKDNKVVLSVNEYGITKKCVVHYLTGETETEISEYDSTSENERLSDYIYSNKISRQLFEEIAHTALKKKIDRIIIKDDINFAQKYDLHFFNFHKINSKGRFDNVFYAVSKEGKIILKETLNENINRIEPESFFIKGNLLFLLFNNSGFGVYKIIY